MPSWIGYLIVVAALLVGIVSGKLLSRRPQSVTHHACPCGPDCRCRDSSEPCGCEAAARRLKAAAGVGASVHFLTGEAAEHRA